MDIEKDSKEPPAEGETLPPKEQKEEAPVHTLLLGTSPLTKK